MSKSLPNKKVIVKAGLKIKEDCLQSFLDYIHQVIEKSNAEEGCLEYSLICDIADKRKFFFFEEYLDMDAFEKHRQMPYIQELRKKREEYVEEYLGVRVFEVSQER